MLNRTAFRLLILMSLCLLVAFGVSAVGVSAQDATPETLSCDPGFIPFDHELLVGDPVCIPEHPVRIAAVDTFTLETLVSLGITPVSGPFLESFTRDHEYVAGLVEGITDTGFPVNPEVLVELDPDLIISIEPWISDFSAEVSEIAPTVTLQYPGDNNWRQIAEAVAAAVNQTEAFDTLLAGYDARVQTFKDMLVEQPSGDVSIAFLFPDTILAFLGETFSGGILQEVGLHFPQQQLDELANGWEQELSAERLDLLASSDHIFVLTSSFNAEDLETNAGLIEQLGEDLLWQTLPAVQAEHVHLVGRDWLGSSVIAANVVLDDMFRGVFGVDPAEVSPNPYLTSVEATPEATEVSS